MRIPFTQEERAGIVMELSEQAFASSPDSPSETMFHNIIDLLYLKAEGKQCYGKEELPLAQVRNEVKSLARVEQSIAENMMKENTVSLRLLIEVARATAIAYAVDAYLERHEEA